MLYAYSWDSSNKQKGFDMESRELFELREELKAAIDKLRGDLKDVDQNLKDTYLSRATAALSAEGKDFGTTSIVDGNRKIKAVVTKKVSWDQDSLREALGTLSDEDARHYGKLTFAVEERKFTNAPPAIRSVLEECRTTEVGRFTVELDT